MIVITLLYYPPRYCTTTTGLVEPWGDLVNGTAATKLLMNADQIFYRFYNPDPCGPVTMHVNLMSGLVLSYGSRTDPATTDDNDWAIPTPWRPLYHFYCPHNYSSLAGTYFFTFKGKGDNANFNVTVTSYLHEPDTVVHPTCTIPDDYTYASNDTAANIGTPQELTGCLQPNAPYHGVCEEINANYLFLYQITSCQRLHVQLSMNTIGMDADIYGRIHSTQTDSDFLSWDYVSYLEGDDYLQMSLCGTESEPIYLTVVINCWSVEEPSNYTLIVANQSDTTFRAVPISKTFPYWEVVETAGFVRFLLPNSKPISDYDTDDWAISFACTDYSFTCYQLWPVYPADNVNIFWPTPAFLITQLRNTELDTLYLNISQANPRQLKFAVLLQLEVDGSMQYFLPESDLPAASFLFYGKIVNAEGLPVYGQYNATETFPECNYTSFLDLKAQTENLISDVGDAGDPTLLQMMQYQLDAVRFNEVWVGCSNLLNTLFTKDVTTNIQNSTNCIYPYQSDEWFNDGCCFTGTGWNIGCIPRLENVSVSAFAIDNKQVENKCAHPTCATGLLNFYQLTLEDSGCTSTLTLSPTDYTISTIEKYRGCKEAAFTQIADAVCYTNAGCMFQGVANLTCNVITNKCIGDFELQEQYFVKCLIDQMDQSQIITIQAANQMPAYEATDPAFVTALRKKWTTNDCVGSQPLDFTARDYYQYDNFQPDCPASTIPPCPAILCEDTSCALPEDSCLNFCDNFYWHFFPGATSDQCQSYKVCNKNSVQCNDSTDCATDCTGNFCSVCTDSMDCRELPANSSSNCTALTPCLLPSGEITDLPPNQCNATFGCSHSCGYTCVARDDFTQGASGPLCVLYNVTEDTCTTDYNGSWFNDTNLDVDSCTVMGLSSADCTALGSDWEYVNCTAITTSSCFANLACELQTVECATPEQCKAAGSCTDAAFLVDLDARRYGGCIQDKAAPVDIYFRYKLLPLCEPPLYTIPNACLDTSFLSADECEASGFVWREPASDFSTCTSDMGCYEYYPELGIVGYQFAFSPKTENVCNNFGTQSTWKSLYDWTPATAVYGMPLTPQWIPASLVFTHNYLPALNFTTAYNSYIESATVKLALQSKSTGLCEYSRTIQSLTAITCDCLADNLDNDVCFQSIGAAVTVAQVQPCGGTEEEVQSSGVSLYFDNSAVPRDVCANVIVSSLTASIFHDVGAIRLASSFAKLDTLPQAFAITNENKAVVGTLLGDGVEITVDKNITNALLCLAITELSNSKKYTIYDFAYSNDLHNALHPYGLATGHLDNLGNQTAVCAYVNLTGKSSFLPIVHQDHWQTKKFTLYDRSTTGLIYTLAVLFTITAAMTLSTLGLLIVQNPQRYLSVVNLLLFMVFLFTVIRAISLFLMPAGISSAVLNYVLVILPTFFYFTAFTLAVIIWAVLSSNVLLKPLEQIKRVGCIVNLFLYLFFIVVVLVFHYTGKKTDNTCGFLAAPSTYSSAQKAISILYAVVIAAISLVIGILFLVYGYRVNAILTGGSVKGGTGSRRMFMFALVYSISFILHCIFTIILSALNEPQVVFSFLGLIITEVVPSFYLSWFLGISKKLDTSSGSPGASNQKSSSNSQNLSRTNSKQNYNYDKSSKGSNSSKSMSVYEL